MATIFNIQTKKETKADPVLHKKYLWFCHDKLVLVIKPIRHTAGGPWQLSFEVYEDKGCWPGSATEMTWTAEEMNNAILYPLPPKPKLGANEELCHFCGGTLIEQERDLCFFLCFWCNGTGKRKKPQAAKPTHSQRSPLHPRVPSK